jgi:hypothetical protein
MTVKGSRSRVRNHAAYRENLQRILDNMKNAKHKPKVKK